MSNMIFDMLREFIYDVKDTIKDYVKTKMFEKKNKPRVESRFKEPEEGEMILYTSKYCPNCEEVLKKDLVFIEEFAKLKKLKFKIVSLDTVEDIDKAMKMGIEDIPIVAVRINNEVRFIDIDSIVRYVIEVKNR